MADFNDPPKRRDTLETYSSLVRTEVKSLTARLADMSVEIAAFSENFGAVLMQIEDLSSRVDSVQGGIDFCRSELSGLKKIVASFEQQLAAIQDLVNQHKGAE
jgi:chromosome segregation ATPase